MIARLFRKKEKAYKKKKPSVPEGKRVYAIGDVHGCKSLLEQLLTKIEKDSNQRGDADVDIIFLGDLIDRGPDSCGVLNLSIDFKKTHPNTYFLMGNHEEMFLKAAIERTPKIMRFFLRIGGTETLLSYDILRSDFMNMDVEQLCDSIPELIPNEHIEFVQSFEEYMTVGDYMFVHAGIKPGVPLDQQDPQNLRWIRDDFVEHKGQHGKIIVFGHTIFDEVRERKNHIGIDTGAYKNNVLTALCLEGEERWYLQAKVD